MIALQENNRDADLQNIPIQFVKGVGPARAKQLAQLNIHTVHDLLYLLPRRYEDRRTFLPIGQLMIGQYATVMGEVVVGGKRLSFSSRKVVEVVITDSKHRLTAVWFNQPYMANFFKPGVKVILYGRVVLFRQKLQMMAPDFELIDENDQQLHMGRIVPVYPLTKGMGQRFIRHLVYHCLNQYAAKLKDVLPQSVRVSKHLQPINKLIYQLHFPQNEKEQQEAIDRIAFEEFFLFQIAVIHRRQKLKSSLGIAHQITEDFLKEFSNTLSFKLTLAQQRSLNEILNDMKNSSPMLRLIQGDVGSGKTVVAFAAAIAAILNGYQSVILAPTEILAQQHFLNWQKMFIKGPYAGIKATLLVSNMSKKEKDIVLNDLAQGQIDLVVGTHALLENQVRFKNLGLAVIDEQHKFGVNQRALLTAKGRYSPDVLVMTATPIPRTLCLTLYGDVDVSLINELPPGRGEIKTYHVPMSKAQSIYTKIKEWVKKGIQAYIIYPLVDESEMLDLKSASVMFEELKHGILRGISVALIHGQMPKAEVDEVMSQFKAGQIKVLVSTTILEVGIDVANANLMVIEHAERFGLSQLHQLRGRIGRGDQNAVCILLSDPKTEDAKRRLNVMTRTRDGFEIAEEDLAIRGPGHYFGHFQHGMNELKVANPITQLKILEAARLEAIQLLQKDEQLKMDEHGIIKMTIEKRYPNYLDFINAG